MITKQQAEEIFEKLVHKNTYKILSKEYGYHPSTLCKYMKQFKADFNMNENDTFCVKNYLKYKYNDLIVEKYLNGESSQKIISDFGFSDDSIIRDILRENNIQINSTGYKSKTDQSLFSSITNELEAYVLGLITSDGSVDKNYMIAIHLTETDKPLLEDINNKLFCSTGHILVSEKKVGNPVARLSICGKQICQNLAQYGVVNNKSDFLTSLPKLDEHLMKHYIRGLFDGDGVCAKNENYLRVGFCAKNKEFCQNFQNYLVKQLSLSQNKLFNTGGCWHCSWGAKQDIQKIYNYLYDDSTISLSRKQNKIFNYLNGNSEVTN